MQLNKLIQVPCAVAGSILLANLNPLIAASQEGESAKFESMVVTATRAPRPISEVLSVTTVVTRKDIEILQSKDMFDLLSREAGVSFVRNGGRGSSTSLLLRGNQSDHTLFLIDGIRIGSATLGSASISSINMDLIERVEIVKGPKSALYGSDAIGGVVNLITRTSAASDVNVPLSADISYGSNSTKEFALSGGLLGERHSLSLTASLLDTDGIDHTEDTSGVNGDEDGYDNESLAINYNFEIQDGLDMRLIYSRNEATNDYDANCSDATTFAPVICDIYSDSLVTTFAASIDYEFSDAYKTRLQLGQSKDESEQLARNVDLSSTFNGGIFNTTKREATWLNFLNLTDNLRLTAGLDYSKDEVDGTTAYTVDSRDNEAAFLQIESVHDQLSLNLGLRYDDNDQFGSASTPSLQVGYNFGNDMRLIGSYAEGFKAPTFNDLYFPFFGNPDFVPEESQNYELAFQGQAGLANFYVAAYQNDIENLIQFNSTTFVTDQISEAQITGVEFDVDLSFAEWQLGISGSLLDPEDQLTGRTLRRHPRRTISLDADRTFGDFSLGFSVLAESDRYEDVANTVNLGGYTLVDLRASYAVNEEWKLKARLNNAFDKAYTTAFSFGTGAYESVGREATITVSYTPKF